MQSARKTSRRSWVGCSPPPPAPRSAPRRCRASPPTRTRRPAGGGGGSPGPRPSSPGPRPPPGHAPSTPRTPRRPPATPRRSTASSPTTRPRLPGRGGSCSCARARWCGWSRSGARAGGSCARRTAGRAGRPPPTSSCCPTPRRWTENNLHRVLTHIILLPSTMMNNEQKIKVINQNNSVSFYFPSYQY